MPPARFGGFPEAVPWYWQVPEPRLEGVWNVPVVPDTCPDQVPEAEYGALLLGPVHVPVALEVPAMVFPDWLILPVPDCCNQWREPGRCTPYQSSKTFNMRPRARCARPLDRSQPNVESSDIGGSVLLAI